MAKSINDGPRILSLYKNSENVKLIAFSMGNFGRMNILRVYTQQNNRKKVEITAKSILGELKK